MCRTATELADEDGDGDDADDWESASKSVRATVPSLLVCVTHAMSPFNAPALTT